MIFPLFLCILRWWRVKRPVSLSNFVSHISHLLNGATNICPEWYWGWEDTWAMHMTLQSLYSTDSLKVHRYTVFRKGPIYNEVRLLWILKNSGSYARFSDEISHPLE